MGYINYTLTPLTDLNEETRSTLHLTTNIEVLVNNQFFQFSVLRMLINWFYQLLNGHLCPDIVESSQIEVLYLSLKNKTEKHGITLVAEDLSDLYQYEAQFFFVHKY